MSRSRALWVGAIIQLILITGLSGTGVYHWPSKAEVTLEIVTMLTPLGILKNTILYPDNPLFRFYFEKPRLPSVWDQPSVGACLAGLWIIGGLFLFRKGTR